MMSSLYVGATGMKSLGEGLAVVSNNLANQNTVGFRRAMMLYQDLGSTNVPTSSNGMTNFSQAGKGVTPGIVRTMFENGGYESSTTATDLSITGIGFFAVQKPESSEVYYTRAGNFRFTKDGDLITPNGFNLMGNKVVDGVTSGTAEPIKIDFSNTNGSQNVIPPKATTNAGFILNLGFAESKQITNASSFTGLLSSWNGQTDTKNFAQISDYSTGVKIYDSEGNPQIVNGFFKYVGDVAGGNKAYEFIMTVDPKSDTRSGIQGTKSAGILMSGTIVFDSAGNMKDMAAFVPDGSQNPEDFTTWKKAGMNAQGVPVANISFKGKNAASTASQNVGIDFGMSFPSGWDNAIDNPTQMNTLGQNWVSNPTPGKLATHSSTAYKGTSSSKVSQDGYTTGYLSRVRIDPDGYLVGQYTNGESQNLYRIPLTRFTSQDNLTHSGNNLFSASDRVGSIEEGFPGTENYGALTGYSLETSNVDMTTEFVQMIVTQRGFQMNSKVVTTSDQMIQKALELKR
ncbi:flagellar hook protein FlgE [Desulfovibrio litoralis]|uniref:Flagellar hook protein FlgE n=1 Tax=Desulfovibrio litoralis DSM 11393 TaxID=1121455 RepID=A0A1M7SFL8_9BACT|nr:flagellar hook-basal body complex protein [Desulfovibrio litoralis]SHN57297.1 flagellar hook protein FlgE [Desulfovibrio litoralis DSM 11393]